MTTIKNISNAPLSILDIPQGKVIFRKDGIYKYILLTYAECETEQIILFNGDCPVFLPLDENIEGWYIYPTELSNLPS